ncbi:MAG: sugar phosphate isomerase/epimerase family protein [Thermoproteota archaeon]
MANMMKPSICNELFLSPIEETFKIASKIGYKGVEIAPFTLIDDVRKFTDGDASFLRNLAASNRMEIVGTHWILVSPPGLHLTHPDVVIRRRTKEYLMEVVRFTANINGKIVVLGSPKQRSILDGVSGDEAWRLAKEALTDCCNLAERLDVHICIEPLSRSQTNFINTADEAIRMVKEVGSKSLKITLDVYSMSDEAKPLDCIITSAGSLLGHFHANDTNGRGPGHGNADYHAIFRALGRIGYDGYVSVEVFDRFKDPVSIAEESLNTLKPFLSLC